MKNDFLIYCRKNEIENIRIDRSICKETLLGCVLSNRHENKKDDIKYKYSIYGYGYLKNLFLDMIFNYRKKVEITKINDNNILVFYKKPKFKLIFDVKSNKIIMLYFS